MLEDGLKDDVTHDDEAVSYVMDMWKDNKDWNDMIDEEKDSIGAKYMKVVNHMSFSDYAIFTVELPVSKQGISSLD